MKDERKADCLKPELTLLKTAAPACDIRFNRAMSDAQLLEDLWNKVADHPAKCSQELIAELREYRLAMISKCQGDPQPLIRWLYENQVRADSTPQIDFSWFLLTGPTSSRPGDSNELSLSWMTRLTHIWTPPVPRPAGDWSLPGTPRSTRWLPMYCSLSTRVRLRSLRRRAA